MDFYIYLNGARRGPFAAERVQSFLADGLLQPSDLVSSRPDGGWKPASSFSEFNAVPPEPSAAPPLPTPALLQVPEQTNQASPEPRLAAEALGPYSRSTLAPNETPYFKTSLHWIVFVRFGFLALLVFLFAAIPFAIAVQAVTGSELGWFILPLPVFILLPPALAFASSELVITDRRVLIKTGIVRRQSVEMFVSKVESIAVDQGFLGRIFDYGTVIIRGTGGFEEPFEAIANPILFRNWVQRLQSGDVPRTIPKTVPVV